MKYVLFSAAIGLFLALSAALFARPAQQRDVISTAHGELEITFFGHATLMLKWRGVVIHVDPVGAEADYSTEPKADIILVTHHHGDHLDNAAITKLKKSGTQLVYSAACAARVSGGTVVKNGDTLKLGDITVEAVPAYNIVQMRAPGQPFHPRGEGNGYVLRSGDTAVYIAGDTEDIPEMKALKNITVAFLPMNLPYTMTPEMVAAAARSFQPTILYPYHYGETDPQRLVALLQGSGIEVRIRTMK